MLFIAGLAYLIRAVCCLFPGGESFWLENQMHHVAWDGLAHHDTIFPLFIFIAGVSFPYSYAKQVKIGKTRWQIYKKIFIRAAVLVFLGMICNGLLKLQSGPQRFFSVLERIGVAGMFASILYINFKPRGRIIIAALILIVYGAISFIVAPDAPAGTSPLSLEGSIAARMRNTVIYATSNRRHLVKETFDDGSDKHSNDTVQERISLSERFGITITYSRPQKNLYLEIVHALAEQNGLDITMEELDAQAEQFALQKSGRSARAAKQLIDQLLTQRS